MDIEPQSEPSKFRNRFPKLPRIGAVGRLCCACRERKADTEFRKDKRTADGIAYRCRACAYKIERRWRTNNLERYRDNARGTQRRAYANDPDRLRETLRRSRLRTKFGIELEDLIAMLDSQNWKCKICSKPLAIRTFDRRKGNVACVDHDHKTKKIRGILCSPCNRGLGLFGDNANTLLCAVKYLDGPA